MAHHNFLNVVTEKVKTERKERTGKRRSQGYDRSYRYVADEFFAQWGFYMCQNPLCFAVVDAVTVHHLDGTHYNKDRDNLICLCRECHDEEDRLHGDRLDAWHYRRRIHYKNWVAAGRQGPIFPELAPTEPLDI